MSRSRVRRALLLTAIGVASIAAVTVACVGSDPDIDDPAAPPAEGGAPDAEADGATTVDADAGSTIDSGPRRCPAANETFADDFSGRADLQGCWTEVTSAARYDASAGIEPVGEDGGGAFRVRITGDNSGADEVHLRRTMKLRAPAIVRWGFRIDLPNLGGPKAGITSLTVTYAGSGAGERESVPMVVGAPNGETLSAFLDFSSTPAVTDLVSAEWHSAELTVGTDNVVLVVDGRPCTTLPIELTAPRDIVEIELGVKAGTIAGTYETLYDDVVVETL